eukprot:scaffold215349_cov19-Tisochrysis_lutea.AAC.1
MEGRGRKVESAARRVARREGHVDRGTHFSLSAAALSSPLESRESLFFLSPVPPPRLWMYY